MVDLNIPENPEAPGAMHQWCDRVEAHFTQAKQPAGVQAAQQIRAALDSDSVDEQGFETLMAEASMQILKASLLESRDAYAKLVEPVEKERRKHRAGTDEHDKLGHALDTYRIVVKLFSDAATALDDRSPDGRAKMEAAVEKAKSRLASLETP